MKERLKKINISTIILGTIVLLLLIPYTGKPIKIFIQRLVASSPSEVSVGDRQQLEDYQWQLRDQNGGLHDLSSSKGKIVLINFWATWCPPCVAEMPSLQKLYDSYGDEIDFYFVSNEASEVTQKFLEKYDYALPLYRPVTDTPEHLRSNILPTTYLIDQQGTIIIREEGVAKWDSEEMRRLLDQLLKESKS